MQYLQDKPLITIKAVLICLNMYSQVSKFNSPFVHQCQRAFQYQRNKKSDTDLESRSGQGVLCFLRKGKPNFSVAPAPSCPVGFGEEDSMSFRPTRRVWKDPRRQRRTKVTHRYNNTVLRMFSQPGGRKCFLSHTLEI